MKAALLLLSIYVAAVIDVTTGLNLNLYGWGREPLYFAMGTVTASIGAYRWEGLQGARIGMIVIILCGVWLVFYPAKNGFDVVLLPALMTSAALQFWQKMKRKK